MIDPDLIIGNDVSMDEVGSDARLQEIASQFSELEYVEAVVLDGSAAAGTSDSQSDYDLYVYSRHPVNVAFRENLLRPRAQRLDLHRTFWEEEDAWIEPDAIEFQIMYRSCAWTEGELSARLDRCEATLGYTTAICYSIERSRTLWDRSGWFERLQRRLLVIERSHATSDQVRTGSMSDAKYSASADSPSWSGMSWSSGAVRFIAFRPGGSLKELRTSRSRRPSRGAVTVSTSAEQPAASTRRTSAVVTARSLYT